MKTILVHQYGKDGLRASKRQPPLVGERDVVVRVCAASINPFDRMVRDEEFKMLLPHRLPFALGHDLAGAVVHLGSQVTDFQVGNEIYACPLASTG
jgi:NADPH:quinone reductase-like Zn-dependent oxidoreductase